MRGQTSLACLLFLGLIFLAQLQPSLSQFYHPSPNYVRNFREKPDQSADRLRETTRFDLFESFGVSGNYRRVVVVGNHRGDDGAEGYIWQNHLEPAIVYSSVRPDLRCYASSGVGGNYDDGWALVPQIMSLVPGSSSSDDRIQVVIRRGPKDGTTCYIRRNQIREVRYVEGYGPWIGVLMSDGWGSPPSWGQSSYQEVTATSGSNARSAFDGDGSTSWMSSYNSRSDSITFNLGRSFPVTAARINWREPPAALSLRVSPYDQHDNWTSVFNQQNHASSGCGGSLEIVYNFSDHSPAEARRFQVLGTDGHCRSEFTPWSWRMGIWEASLRYEYNWCSSFGDPVRQDWEWTPKCFQGVECQLGSLSHTCGACPEGYKSLHYTELGYAGQCVKVNCDAQPCQESYSCRNTDDGPPFYECTCDEGRVVDDDGLCRDNPCVPDGQGDPPCPAGEKCTPSWTQDGFKSCTSCGVGEWSDGVTCRDFCNPDDDPCHSEAGSECIPNPDSPGFECTSCNLEEGWGGNPIRDEGPCIKPCEVEPPCLENFLCQPHSNGTRTCRDPCDNSDCKDPATCTPLGAEGYSCHCPEHWSGSGTHVDPCLSPCDAIPCHPKSTCELNAEADGGYICQGCEFPWAGDGYGDDGCTDACGYESDTLYPCTHDGLCQNTNSTKGYECACPANLTGPGEAPLGCFDPCEGSLLLGIPNPACYGNCTHLTEEPWFECGDCPPGMEGDGKTCIVDVCDREKDLCYDESTCTNSADADGGYTCGDCPDGYAGDGYGEHGCLLDVCTDEIRCQQFSDCVLIPESPGFECICHHGYIGNGSLGSEEGCVLDTSQSGSGGGESGATEFTSELWFYIAVAAAGLLLCCLLVWCVVAARRRAKDRTAADALATFHVQEEADEAGVGEGPGGIPADLPPGWTQHFSEEGLPFWYNADTGESVWEFPKSAEGGVSSVPAAAGGEDAVAASGAGETGASASAAAETAPAGNADPTAAAAPGGTDPVAAAAVAGTVTEWDGWRKQWDEQHGIFFYWHDATATSQWEPPAGWPEEA